MFKKIVISVIVSSLLVQASNPLDLDNNFINTTNSATWKDPSSGITYYAGPNLEYRFANTSRNNAPWLQVQAPSISVGCNGLSIKGGFMALIGLNDIKDQLTDAGASFAWGVMMVVVQTLPGVGEVFTKIQNWARQIQSLLANACQAGQNWAKDSKLVESINSAKSSIAESEGAKGLMEAVQSIDTFFDKIEGLGQSESESLASKTATDKMTALGSGVSMFTMTMGQSVTSGCKLKDKKITFTIEDALKGEIEECGNISNIPNEDDFKKAVMSYKVGRIIFGDIGVGVEDLAVIDKLFDADGKFNIKKVKDTVKSGIAQSGEFENFHPTPIPLNGAKTPEQAAKWFMYGDNGSTPTKIENNTIVYYVINQATVSGSGVIDSNGTKSSKAIKSAEDASLAVPTMKGMFVVSDAYKGAKKIEIKWKGIYNGSRDNLLYYIADSLKKQQPVKYSNYTYGTTIPNSADQSIPLLLPNMNNYANAIVQEIIANGNIGSAMPLIESLAVYNSKVFADQLLAYTLLSMEEARRASDLTSKPEQQKSYENYLLIVEQRSKEIREILNLKKEEILKDNQLIEDRFAKIIKKQIERRNNTLGNKR